VWGIAGVGKSSLVRTVYYNEMLRSAGPAKTSSIGIGDTFTAFGWVDVPSPFNLTEFAWRLLLDLYSDDPQAKQTAAVSMMEEGQVPILECCKIFHDIRCLVVIDDLRSMQDWDLIKATFLSEPSNCSTIVVITNEEKVAMHCVENDKNQVANIRSLKTDVALNLLKKVCLLPKH
jgi:GTP-binding protein EngB required for normal cell division